MLIDPKLFHFINDLFMFYKRLLLMRCIGANPWKQNMVNLWFYKIGETDTFIVLEMKLTVFQIRPNPFTVTLKYCRRFIS